MRTVCRCSEHVSTATRCRLPAGPALLRNRLGTASIGVELPGSTANPNVPGPPHSVLTEHLIDEPGQPTRDALDQVLAFFQQKLGVTTTGD